MQFFESVTGIHQPAAEEILPQAVENAELPAKTASMPDEARRVLVYLYKKTAILHSQKPHLFNTLCRYEEAVRAHLADVYLQLVLDERQGVAFVKMVDEAAENDDESEESEPVSLMSKRTLSLYDTLILLVLRKHYQERETAGEQKIMIDIERLEAYLSPFVPLTDHASKDRKKLVAKIKDLQKRKLIASVRGEEERFEITPIIRYVVNADMLDSMLQEYVALAGKQGAEANE